MSTTRPYAAGDRSPESGMDGVGAGEPDVGGIGGVDGVESLQGTDGAVRVENLAVAADGSAADELVSDRVRRLTLSGESGVVPMARDFTRRALRDWGWLPAASADRRAAAEDVLLVVSELVTNACLHGGGPEELRLRRGARTLRLEVVDSGGGDPAPRSPHRAGRPGGHGMFIVQRLCLDWGVSRDGDRPGKTVWADLAAPA
jgi:anti-sigma regulatory factor (Ser/Thr protein kinase)